MDKYDGREEPIMDETEMDDIEMAFNCMAQVGTSGSGIEQPVTATIAALYRSAASGKPEDVE